MLIRHVLGFCLFVLILSGYLFLFPAYPLASDHQLIRLFGENREELELLRKMIGEDVNIQSVYADLVYVDGVTGPWKNDSQDDFTSERLAEYNCRFESAQ